MLSTALMTVAAAAALTTTQLDADAQKGYARLLGRAVDRHGLVDYDEIQDKHIDALNAFIKAAADIKEPSDSEEALGLYIDVYNAIVIKAILTLKKPASVLDVPGFFDKTSYKVGGRDVTLDYLEKTMIKRVSKGDPRTHMVLVCGAKGCPILESRPYAGSKLDKRLDEATERYLESDAGARVGEGTLALSQIFEWYAADFGGKRGVLDFVKKHLPAGDTKKLGANPSLSYIKYDWSLNQQKK